MIAEKEKAAASTAARKEPNISIYKSLPRASQGWFTNLLEQEVETAIEKNQFNRVKSLLNLLRAEK